MIENEGLFRQLYKSLMKFASFCFLSYNADVAPLTGCVLNFFGQV
jgi:hypothetical protein